MAVDAGTIFVVYQYQGIVMTLVSIMLKMKVKRKNLREKGHTNSLRYNILLKWRHCGVELNELQREYGSDETRKGETYCDREKYVVEVARGDNVGTWKF
jgi:hypothetical protein